MCGGPAVADGAVSLREWFRRDAWIKDLDPEDDFDEGNALPESGLWREQARGRPGDPPFTGVPPEIEAEGLRHPWLRESASTLAGRLEAVLKERQALRKEVAQLLAERAQWAQLLEAAMASRDVWVQASQKETR